MGNIKKRHSKLNICKFKSSKKNYFIIITKNIFFITLVNLAQNFFFIYFCGNYSLKLMGIKKYIALQADDKGLLSVCLMEIVNIDFF